MVPNPAAIGDGGAAHAGKDHTGDDVDLAKAPRQMTNEDIGKTEQPPGYAPSVHQLGGKNEKGHSNEGEVIDSVQHALRDDLVIEEKSLGIKQI